MDLLFLVGGLVLLVLGAEGLVRGASGLARTWGVSPLAIGLTVVAFGTSTPELAASLAAAVRGQPDLGVANVVGSNSFSVLGILGLAALLRPLQVDLRVIRRDAPLMAAAGAVLFLLGLTIGRLEGILLLAGLVAYTAYTYIQAKREGKDAEAEFAPLASTDIGTIANALLVVAGLGLLALGATALVQGAVSLARGWGVSETLIGLTVVAMGTSLPELATSAVAASRGQADVAVGNIVGSNLFNVLGILGVASLVTPLRVHASLYAFDYPVMVGVSLWLWWAVATGHRVSRFEGALLFAGFLAYVAWVVVRG